MNRNHSFLAVAATLIAALSARAAGPKAGESPADHLPRHIKQLTAFGERPDWSADGRKILFLSKTFGDAMEIELSTKAIRNLTAHYAHHGYTRAMYLANGDILLAGPESFDPRNTDRARRNCFLYVLDKSLSKPAMPLGVHCNEGPAPSRTRMRVAWTEWASSSRDRPPAFSQIHEADLVYEDGKPKLANQRLVLDSRDLPFRCTMEVQNFRPPEENELTFSAYRPDGKESDVCGVNITTKKVTNYTDTPDEYDEPEGIYPDGQYTLVECDRHNRKGAGKIDLWRLRLDGSGEYVRLTHFSDYPGYKASNPVVSDNGRFIAFQLGRTGDAAGVGHGIFIYDIKKAGKEPR